VGEAGLFAKGVRNGVGYCGYIFNDESGLYTVRFRSYSPTLGRWLERDPAGYVDGMGLYEYVRGGPIAAVDPSGLSTATGDRWWDEPKTVNCRPCSQSSRRDLVFDFEDSWQFNQPAGSIEIQTWAALVQELERRVADGTAGKCWTVAGHGWGGVFSPREEADNGLERSGRTKEFLDGKISERRYDVQDEHWCLRLNETEHGREKVRETKAILRFLELARAHLSDGGTLEFGGCEAGAGVEGRAFGEALAREMPGVRILLYQDKVAWSGGRWMQRPDKSFGIQLLQGLLLIVWPMEESSGPVEKEAVPLQFQCEQKCDG
jgi:RHS repeat-associated protein